MRTASRAALLLLLFGCSTAPSESAPSPQRIEPPSALSLEELLARAVAADTATFPGERPWSLPANGFARIIWPDGHRAAEGWTRHGRRHGRWARWYRDGRQMEEGNYRDDVPVGVWRAWDLEGRQLDPTDHGSGLDCELTGPFPTYTAFSCGASGRGDPGVPHRDALQALRRCVGHAEAAIRLAMRSPDQQELDVHFAATQSVEVAAIVDEVTREALDELRELHYDLRIPEVAPLYRTAATGTEALLRHGSLVLRERALEDVEYAGMGAFFVFWRTIARARTEHPGFVPRWYLALEEADHRPARSASVEELWPYGGRDAELRDSMNQIIADDPQLGEALLRRTIARHGLHASTTHLAELHTTLAGVLAARGARDEASAELDRSDANYAAQGCTECRADLAARRPTILKGASLRDLVARDD